jgi:hypothetical protein
VWVLVQPLLRGCHLLLLLSLQCPQLLLIFDQSLLLVGLQGCPADWRQVHEDTWQWQ